MAGNERAGIAFGIDLEEQASTQAPKGFGPHPAHPASFETSENQAPQRHEIEVKGVLGILLRAKFAGDLPAIRPEIESLESKAGFRIAAALRQKILQAAGE